MKKALSVKQTQKKSKHRMIYHYLGLLEGVQTTINYPYRKIVVTS